MNYVSWNLEADRLKKCIQYSPNVEVEKYFTGVLVKHLHIKPTIDAEPTTPLPEITEPSTVEKFGDGWIEWAGDIVPFNQGERVKVRFRDGDICEGAAVSFFWNVSKKRDELSDIIAYRVVKD